MKKRVFFSAILIFLNLLPPGAVSAEYPFSDVRIYKNSETICGVEFSYSGEENILPTIILASYSGSRLAGLCVRTAKNILPDVNEIHIGDFSVPEENTLKVFIRSDLNSQTPLCAQTAPEIISEKAHVEGNSAEWELSESGKTICKYLGSEENVEIPNYIGEKHITAIGSGKIGDPPYVNYNIFGGGSVQSISIPEGIEAINHCAFYSAITNQNDLALPESLKKIGVMAFLGCSGLKGNLALPKNLSVLREYAFRDCGFDGTLIIPDTLTEIPSYAFCRTNFTGGLNIPSSVKSIGTSAFYGCGKFSSLTLSDGLRTIGAGAFYDCRGFKGNLIIPDSVKSIEYWAFGYCRGFNGTLKLSENLVHIGDMAFNHCAYFSGDTLNFPESLQIIGGDYNAKKNTGYGSHVFYDFGSFSEYVIPETAEHFQTKDGVLFNRDMTRLVAYPNKKADATYEIPEGVTQLDELCFNQNKFLKTLVLPNSFVLNYDIPENVLNHDGHNLAVALYQYTGLQNIEVKDDNPNYCALNGCLYSKDMEKLWYIPNQNSPKRDIVIPGGVSEIANGAVYSGAPERISWNTLTIPASVETIGTDTLNSFNLYPEKIILEEDGFYIKNENGKIVKK